MTDQVIEQEIVAKGLIAPRITPNDVEANISAEYFFTAEQAVSGFNSAMVDRFLGWKLPPDFAPDAGISFKPTKPYDEPGWWPTGTNLFHAEQTKEMLQHVVGGAPVMPGLSLLTFCVLVLKNGTKVVGINYGPVSPDNFDAVRGRTEARANAIEQIWPLMGYELRSKLDPGLEGPGVPITLSKAISMLPNQDGLLPPFGNGSAKVTDSPRTNSASSTRKPNLTPGSPT